MINPGFDLITTDKVLFSPLPKEIQARKAFLLESDPGNARN